MKTVTITLNDNIAAALLQATGSECLETAVTTAINARLHLLGYDLTGGEPSEKVAWTPPSKDEVASIAAEAVRGMEEALKRLEN